MFSISEEAGVVLLALHEHVHVLLTHGDGTRVVLHAREEHLVVVHAGVLLLLLELLVLWGLGVLDGGGSLLLGSGSTGSVVAGAGAHDTADGLVSNLGASTHGHTSGEGAT